MIVLLLAAVIAIVAFLDISSNWLDDETTGILYFNTDAQVDAEKDAVAENSTTSQADDDSATKEKSNPDFSRNQKTENSEPQKSTKKSSISMKERIATATGIDEEELLQALQKEADSMQGTKDTYDIPDLDELEELDEYGVDQNEIKSDSNPLSDAEAEAAVSDIFEKFKESL